MNPREVHLESLYLIFHVLWKNTKKRQLMDPYTLMIDEIFFRSNSNWVEFYGDVVEEVLPLIPEPLGEPVLTYTFLLLR